MDSIADEQKPLLNLPTRDIPGDYGIPFFSPIKDRLDYYYNLGEENFFRSKINLHSSTVFRTNMPPGPFMSRNPRVIALLDAASFPALFDTANVEKRDVFTGTYMPSTKLTGGHRVCSYLDPSEPSHAKIKQFLFNLLASRKSAVIPSFRSSYAAALFASLESQIASDGRADFNKLNDEIAFDFVGDAYFAAPPAKLGASGLQSKVTIWLLIQLAPLVSNIITHYAPKWVEDLLLHTFPLPSIIAKPGYKKMYAYFRVAGASALDMAEKAGLSREEACHNLVFATCFNTYGGLKVLFPGVVRRVAQAGAGLHARIAKEAREAVAKYGENGLLTAAALERMELVNSVVYEVLRIDPPVKFQYAHAKKDFVVQSHEAKFQVHYID